MIQSVFRKFKSEIDSYSRSEIIFIFLMMAASFLITAEAGITRASANSVFLTAYSAKFFPTAWLASVPLNFIIVSFYNRFIHKFGCIKMMTISIGSAICMNTISAFYLDTVPGLPFVLYLWKDIFIILTFQQLWSVIHATVNISKAKYLYGIFFGMGGLGSVFGSLFPSFLAVSLGTEKLLLTTIPFYLLILATYYSALKRRESIATKQDIRATSMESTDILSGFKLIQKSKFLVFILALVTFMQVSATILDYQFNTILEKAFTVQDLRTQFLGRFFGIINSINVVLQFIGSFVLVRLVGLKWTHFCVPFYLGINALGFLFFPTFKMMSLSFGSIKAMDYSIFGIIKEMLYIPLKVEEKFKAKAVIDVFAYRTSKALASLVIIALQSISWIAMPTLLSWSVLVIFSAWMLTIITMFKYYDFEVERHHENWNEPSKSTS